MAEKKIKVKIEAEADEFARAMIATKEIGVKALDAVMAANKQSSIAVREHGDRVIDLEKIYKSSLTASQKTALQLAEVRKARVEDAAAADLQRKAIAALEAKLEDQLKRERANKGRSLSMLFDELRESLSAIPGPAGKAASALGALQSSGEAGFASIGSLVGMSGLLVGGLAAAGGAAVAMASDIAETVTELDRAAKFAGLSTEALSRYRTMAKATGLEVSELGEFFAELHNKATDARNGSKSQADAFALLGITVEDLRGPLRDNEALLSAIAERFATATDKATATKGIMDIFGDDLAKKLAPALARGAKGLEEFKAQNDALGLSLNEVAVRDAARMTAATEALHQSWTGITEYLERKALPTIADLALAVQRALNPESVTAQQKILELQSQIDGAYADMQNLNEAINARASSGGAVGGLKAQAEATAQRIVELAQKLNELKKQRGDFDQKPAFSAPAPGGESKPSAGGSKAGGRASGADKAAQEAEKAAREEASRVESLEQAIRRLTEARVQDELAALEGADKIRATFQREKVQIEEQREAALELAKTEQERAEINRAADRAIVASRKAAQKELDKLRAQEAKANEKAEAERKQMSRETVRFALESAQGFAAAGSAIAKGLAESGRISSEKAAKTAKAFAIFQAALQIPLAIATTFAQAAGGPVAKGVQAGVAGAVAGLNLAAVIATPIPSFVRGGIVPELPGQPYSRNQGDNQLVSARSGEAILTQAQQARLLALADGHGSSRDLAVSLVLDQREMGRAMARLASRNSSFRQAIKTNPVGITR